jgi:uncharacterized membrane protein YgaE (UPF0421/DUF939 family)
MSHRQLLHHAIFVLRCTVAATLAYLLAAAVGLAYPVWASISGIIVSQEKLDETKNAALWRLAGTLTGIVIAIVVGAPLNALTVAIPVQIAISVAICAMIARRWSGLRVAMWTAPIIYLSHTTEVPLIEAGLWRGAEVMLGGCVGAVIHWLADISIGKLETHVQ